MQGPPSAAVITRRLGKLGRAHPLFAKVLAFEVSHGRHLGRDRQERPVRQVVKRDPLERDPVFLDRIFRLD